MQTLVYRLALPVAMEMSCEAAEVALVLLLRLFVLLKIKS